MFAAIRLIFGLGLFALFGTAVQAQTCVISHPYLSPLDNQYYQLCWTESAPGVLDHSVIGFQLPEQCDADGLAGDGDGDPPGCSEPGPTFTPAVCDNDPTTDAPACRLPDGCGGGTDGRADGGQCYCTTGDDDALPDCAPGT